MAEATLLPLIALAEMTTPPAAKQGGSRCLAISCAGAIRGLEHAISLRFEVALTAARQDQEGDGAGQTRGV